MKNKKLTTAREKSGKTQKQVAEEIKISVRNYQDYEYNINIPNVLTAIKIANALGVENLRELWSSPKF